MSHTINYNLLPESMRDGVRRYIERGIPGGSFQTAVFANELVQAFDRADAENTAAIRMWAMFLHHEAPSDCWGDRETVRAWIAQRGLAGLDAA